jgi:hypothetical protein
MGGQHNPLIPEVIVVHPDDEMWFWNWLADERAANGGSAAISVNDLRPPAGDTEMAGRTSE